MESMMKITNAIVPLALSVLLCACGGSSDTAPIATPSEVNEPQTVTSSNIAQAISISGAASVDINNEQIPNELKSIESSNVESVVVSANSKFNVELSVPADEVPSGKKVAGYLIEINETEHSFIPVQESTLSALSKNIQSEVETNKSKKSKSGKKLKSVASASTFSILTNQAVEGNTSIDFSGWGNSDFVLNESLEGIILRIYPLLVNEEVANILTIEDVDLTDETSWVGVQELLLNVEAVATAEIQISLTWNSITDIDLWVIEPNGDKIYYANSFSSASLGWLDYDNIVSYGPENITFNYKMPEGDYKVYVHHFDGGVETDYQVTVAIGDNVTSYVGGFPEGVTASEEIADEGVDFITTISVNATINSRLETPIATSQYQGTWKLPEGASTSGYIDVNGEDVDIYYEIETECLGISAFSGSSFITGFRLNEGVLQVSDAMLSGANDLNFTYKILDVELSTLPDSCEIIDDGYYDDDYEEFAE